MNYSMIRYILCRVLEFTGIFLLLPCIVATIYREKSGYAFFITMFLCFLTGIIGKQRKPASKVFYAREGFVTVSLSWIMISAIGAMPYYISGEIPRYTDALFETVAGLSTTGGSILSNVESLSYSVQFWRMFTHWIGGMGVLVLILAILPLSGSYNMHLMRAESPGPSVGKLVPRIKHTAMILYSIYIFFTIIQVISLLVAGLSPYEALTLSFSTMGTGGFGLRNSSMADYSRTVQLIVMVFMLFAGINFNIYYLFLIKRPKEALANEELKVFLGIIAVVTLLIGWDIGSYFIGRKEALFQACFQVISIITSTGFTTMDFGRWPQFSQSLIFAVMLMGACAGSTGGGFKISRVIILFKTAKNELAHVVHARSVKRVRYNGHALSGEVIKSVQGYLVIYITVLIISFLLLSFNQFDFTTTMTAVVTSLNNVGPGLGQIGPAGSFAIFNDFSKYVLMFDMLIGRLELIPMLILFAPSTWKR